ncbi:glycosyltransferase family 4 protein [Paxillus involutus ATCC 200175]|uniref:Glycosyltransferase family 4 protein n=1 Tax=Paxillus involutus ATCC 200175 TaxID=664439 RepID=A0A0C9SYM4_PAXIN|nr:glycosyltransferase family 4 protein [Paxillus involutus ATCC 200175]
MGQRDQGGEGRSCTGLYVVSTRVGGVPEILPEDMISFANPDEDDVFRAISEAIHIVSQGKHDPLEAHERVKSFYDWMEVAERTEAVYNTVIRSDPIDFGTRMQRTMDLGPFAGVIYTTILIVDCLFFLLLEWWMPREDMDFVQAHWKTEVFSELARKASRAHRALTREKISRIDA